MKRLTLKARIKGVDVYFHWSILLAGGVIIAGSWPRVHLGLTVAGAGLAILLIHEWGHVYAARRRRCDVWSVEIYPVLGVTHYSAPYSRYDECVIAWGGVAAQAVVAVPFIAWVALFGYTPFDQLNAALSILGGYSLFVAIFNLLPVPPLDGATAWELIPLSIGRALNAWRRRSRQPPWQRKNKWKP